MNRRIVYILFAVIVVVVIGLGWFALISPTRQDVATTNSSITAERDKLATTQAQLRQAEETSKEGRQNQARLLELTKMVPNGDEIPSLLLQIQDLANESGISFMSITPSDLIQVNDYQILPLQVQFEGRFFDLSDFVYRAEQMVAGPGRLLAIKTLGLVPNSTDASSSGSVASSPTLKVSMVLYAFEMNPSIKKSAAAATTPSAQPSTTATTAAGSTATTAAPTSQ